MALKHFMPNLEDVVEDLGVSGIAAIVLLPVLIPVAAGVGKPIAKATIKGGIVLYKKGKGIIAEVGETFEDMVAEAKAELAEAKTPEVEATTE
jgi:hypothetical protein